MRKAEYFLSIANGLRRAPRQIPQVATILTICDRAYQKEDGAILPLKLQNLIAIKDLHSTLADAITEEVESVSDKDLNTLKSHCPDPHPLCHFLDFEIWSRQVDRVQLNPNEYEKGLAFTDICHDLMTKKLGYLAVATVRLIDDEYLRDVALENMSHILLLQGKYTQAITIANCITNPALSEQARSNINSYNRLTLNQ